MLEKFVQYISENRLCTSNDNILLSVSGGIDSMVMTDLFLKAGFHHMAIAHCNFKLRGKEADMDEELVRKFGFKYKIPFYNKSFNTTEFADKNKLSVQMAARKLRMFWLEEIVDNEGFSYYATANHLDDQIETLFINLFRGTGISGIRGLLPKQGKLIHPLLFAAKIEIIDYARENRIKFREDASNKETDYLRNKIRHRLIPVIEEIYPHYRNTMNKSMKLFKSVEEVYRHQISDLTDQVFSKQEKFYSINIAELKKLPFTEICLYEIIKEFQFNDQDARDILAGLDSQSGKVYFSSTHRIVKDRNHLLIEKMSDQQVNIFYIDEHAEKIQVPVKLEIFRFKKSPEFKISADKNLATIDSGKLIFPLKIRKWKKGDYFYPLGMGGKKLISDYFIDEKIPIPLKEKTYLLLSGNEVVWVIGHRINERFKITDKTLHITQFSLVK